ncbi:hypothetical protein ACF0H5_011924 [Mactra antiquata]
MDTVTSDTRHVKSRGHGGVSKSRTRQFTPPSIKRGRGSNRSRRNFVDQGLNGLRYTQFIEGEGQIGLGISLEEATTNIPMDHGIRMNEVKNGNQGLNGLRYTQFIEGEGQIGLGISLEEATTNIPMDHGIRMNDVKNGSKPFSYKFIL